MFLKPLRVLFGLLGTLLGASWSLLGDLGPPWGEVGVVLGRLLGHFDFLSFFGANMEAKLVPKGRHFGSQNGAKIDPKSRCEFNNEKVTSWSRLGSIWARFPSRLGDKNVDFSLIFKGFRENQRFWSRWVSKSDLRPKMEQKWSQNATPNGSPNGSNIDPNIW